MEVRSKRLRHAWEWPIRAVLLVYPMAAAQSPPADLRGIYVYAPLEAQVSSSDGQAAQAALTLSGSDGMLLVGEWSTIEPTMGQYDWSSLDRWMNYAISAGRKINIAIKAGTGIPSWLFQPAPGGAGATPLSFTISPHDGGTNVCISETIAAPWDPAFLNQWDSMLAALSAHLKSAGTYNALTLLRLTGINRTSDELRLPAETAQSTGLSCVSNSITTWQQAGYKPSKLLQAWDAVTSSFLKSFQDKSFSVAIITNPPQLAFPAIAEDGSIISGTVPDENQPLLQFVSQKLSGRLVVQYNFLLPGTAANPFVIQAAQTLGTMAAFQTNNYFSSTGSGSAACSGTPVNATPCDAAGFLQLLETGIYPLGQMNALRAQYIEVWASNANAFPADIQQAHYQLLPFDSKNSASYFTGPLAPDMIAYGEAASVANGLVVAPDGPWPPTLGGARLDITDSAGQTRPALLYFVTASQLGYLIPAATALGPATLKLTTSAGVVINDRFQVAKVSPGLFTANASGSGVAAGFWIRVAANAAQTQGYLFDPTQAVGSRNPVPIDLGASTDQVYLSLYGTGLRGATQATATVGGVNVPVLGFAAVSAYQGEDVVNIGPLPRSFAGQGVVSIVVSFDGEPANTITASIR